MAKDESRPKGSEQPAKETDDGFLSGLADRYVHADNVPANIVGDLSSLWEGFTSLSWLGLDGAMPGYLPDGPLGALVFLVVLALLIVAAPLLALALVCRAIVYSWRIFRALLLAPPGETKLGYLKREPETKKGKLTKLILPAPVKRQCYDDTLRHWQIIGPTGGGKTLFMEEKIRQNLEQGVTTVVMELDGGLAARARYYAALYERDVTVFDPSATDTLIWNPIAGDDPEMVAEQMVNMVASDYITEQFFKDIAIVLTRHAVIAIKSYEERYGGEANLNHLTQFISERSYRDEVLEPHKGKSGQKVTAPWIPEYTKRWFEMVYFGHWDSDHRDSYTSGLANVLERVIGNSALRAAICPSDTGAGATDGQIVIEDAIESGGLVILRLPADALGAEAALATAGWITQRLQSATRARTGSRPLAFYMDEAHLILGKENSKIAEAFRHWLPVCRNYSVGVRLSYQSFSMIEYTLRAILQNNARSKFICGGQGPDDAVESERIAGEKEVTVEEQRTTRKQLIPGGILSSLGQSVSTHQKETTESYYPAHRIRELPPGVWLIRAIDHNVQVPPCLIEVPLKRRWYRLLERRWIRFTVRAPRAIRAARSTVRKRALRISAPVMAPILAKLQQLYGRGQGHGG